MSDIHQQCVNYGTSKNQVDYVKGANIAGFCQGGRGHGSIWNPLNIFQLLLINPTFKGSVNGFKKFLRLTLLLRPTLQKCKMPAIKPCLKIRQRFDFKGSKSEVEVDMKTAEIKVLSDDNHKLNSVLDILKGKLVKRKVSIKALDYGKVESAAGGYGSTKHQNSTRDSSGQRKGNCKTYQNDGN